MNPQALYYHEPLKFEFDARVVEQIPLGGGRTGVILDRTYFYPTGGGQEHDTGSLGGLAVVDVFKEEAEQKRVVHVVEGVLQPGPVFGQVDRLRRQRHMQHHTAQHLLTQCFLRLFEAETVSANINGVTPSTLDLLPGRAFSKAELERAEDLANSIIYEDLPVKAYFVAPEDLPGIPLRKPPKVTEDIRIVEIDGYDYSACGGTHVLSTGGIGVIKIVRTERQNERTRVHFMAGWQALEAYREYQDILFGLAAQFTSHPRDLPGLVQKQADQLRQAQETIQAYQGERIAQEASRLAQAAQGAGGRRVAAAVLGSRPVAELRQLAGELRKQSDLAAALVGDDGQKFSLLITCGAQSGLNAREALARVLTPLGGRGGGDASLAQGGGPLPAGGAAAVLEAARQALLE